MNVAGMNDIEAPMAMNHGLACPAGILPQREQATERTDFCISRHGFSETVFPIDLCGSSAEPGLVHERLLDPLK
jgi:hypothetical protein